MNSRVSVLLAIPVVAAALGLSSCSNQEAQMAMLSENFNSQLEQKNTELAQERAKVEQMQARLAEANAKLKEMELALAESKKAPEVNPVELATTIASTVEGIVDKAVEKINLRIESGTASSGSAGGVGQAAAPQPPQPQPIINAPSSDNGRTRIPITFP